MSISTKRQLKLIILTFWTKFAQIRYFQSKAEKMSTANELCIFELVYNHFHNILRLFYVLPNFLSPQVKRWVIITYKHGIYELPHELPNDLRLRILGN